MSGRAAGAAALLAAVALAGCGSSEQTLSPIEEARLNGALTEARDAAAAGDTAGAREALAILTADLAQLRESGVLPPARTARLERAHAAVAAELGGAAARARAEERAQAERKRERRRQRRERRERRKRQAAAQESEAAG